MPTTLTRLPKQGMLAGFRTFSVAEYHQLIDLGILTEDDNLELLEGYLVHKMSRNLPHDGTIQLVQDALTAVLPPGWCVRVQSAITLDDSEPEPDLSIVRGHKRSYLTRHPVAADMGVVIEVAASTLDSDQTDKARIYARAGLPCYWIVNLVDSRVEVYSAPVGPALTACYSQVQTFLPGTLVPLALDGTTIANVPVRDLVP